MDGHPVLSVYAEGAGWIVRDARGVCMAVHGGDGLSAMLVQQGVEIVVQNGRVVAGEDVLGDIVIDEAGWRVTAARGFDLAVASVLAMCELERVRGRRRWWW